MTDYAKERFDELEAYVAQLPKEDRAEHAAKGQAHPKAIFQMVKTGDAVGLYCSVKKDPSLLENRDDYGMTPLHWGGASKPEVMTEIMLSEPSSAPWARDRFGRLPLDAHREGGHHQSADKIERVTYPDLFRDEKDGPVAPDKIATFAEKQKTLGRTDTRPPFARSIEPREIMPKLKGRERDAGERDR